MGAAEVVVSHEPQAILDADRVVFPGVGGIRDCMEAIRSLGCDQLLDQVLNVDRKPVLAICVGMQALMSHSEENGGVACLDVLPGQVAFFGEARQSDDGERLKVPHMGWNEVRQVTAHPLWQGIDDGARFYFVHSYYVHARERELVAGSVDYGVSIDAGPRADLADDFVLFLAVAERCEAMLEESGLDARIQLATFHPAYRFEGEEIQDPGSFTNRSPYPTMHLLRVVDVSRAIDGFEGNTEDIPAANVEVLRDVGLETLAKRLKALVAWRADEKGEDAILSKKE